MPRVDNLEDIWYDTSIEANKPVARLERMRQGILKVPKSTLRARCQRGWVFTFCFTEK